MTHIVFVFLFCVCSTTQQEKPWYDPTDSDEQNAKAREAYRGLPTVTLRKPDGEEYLKFADQVSKRARENYNYTFASEEVGCFVGSLFYTVLF